MEPLFDLPLLRTVLTRLTYFVSPSDLSSLPEGEPEALMSMATSESGLYSIGLAMILNVLQFSRS